MRNIYKRKSGEVKIMIKDAKKDACQRWVSLLMRDFNGNKNIF